MLPSDLAYRKLNRAHPFNKNHPCASADAGDSRHQAQGNVRGAFVEYMAIRASIRYNVIM
jgi:hypothetical protein